MWPFTRKPAPMVLLKLIDEWKKVRAEHYCGEWYASPYLKNETRTRLLPGGKVEGQSYVHEWRPASDVMVPVYTGISEQNDD